MRDGVLFEITNDQLETGLRGFPIGYCTTSHVDPHKGLTYVGRPIANLGAWNPTDVIYLLYFGEVGTSSQVETFRQDLMQRAICRKETLHAIRALPQTGPAMDLFAAALLLAGVYESTHNYREDCLNVIARIPEIAATLINHHAGWKETPASQPALGYMENFVHMLQIPHLTPLQKEQLIPLFRLFNILHYDHCGGNLSTFVGKAVASGLEPMYGSLAAAMTALAGPRHGGANQDGLAFTQELLNSVGENASPSDVADWLRERLARHELIFGFGHAVLRVEDPRAALFYHYAEKEYSHHPLIKIALLLRNVGPKVLEEHSKMADPHPNIDAITGALLSAAGFPYPAYFPLLFGLSRAVGIAIQIVYERLEARGGKGTPIVRPLYLYKARSQRDQ